MCMRYTAHRCARRVQLFSSAWARSKKINSRVEEIEYVAGRPCRISPLRAMRFVVLEASQRRPRAHEESRTKRLSASPRSGFSASTSGTTLLRSLFPPCLPPSPLRDLGPEKLNCLLCVCVCMFVCAPLRCGTPYVTHTLACTQVSGTLPRIHSSLTRERYSWYQSSYIYLPKYPIHINRFGNKKAVKKSVFCVLQKYRNLHYGMTRHDKCERN